MIFCISSDCCNVSFHLLILLIQVFFLYLTVNLAENLAILLIFSQNQLFTDPFYCLYHIYLVHFSPTLIISSCLLFTGTVCYCFSKLSRVPLSYLLNGALPAFVV